MRLGARRATPRGWEAALRLVLRFIKTYLTPYVWWFLGGAVALVLTNAMTVAIPGYLGEAIDALGQPDAVEVVLRNAGIIAFIGVLIVVIRTLSRVLFFTPGRLVEARVKRDVFERILLQQPAFLRSYPAGDLYSRVSNDVNALRLLAGFGLLSVINVASVLGLTLVQMLRLSPWLTLYMVIPLAIGLGLTQVTIRWLFILIKRMNEEISQLSDYALSTYEGIATVKAFAAEPVFEERFDELNRAYQRTTIQRAALRALISPILTIAGLVNVFLLLWIGGRFVIEGAVTAGDLVAFVSLVAILAGPLRGLSFIIAIVKQAQASLERIYEITDPDIERPDLPEPVGVPSAPPRIELRDLRFTYPDAPEPALAGVSVDVPAGGTLGVFGPTGAGKTTLLRCLTRLYNPPPGTVFIEGRDVRALDLDAWRAQAVLVPQRAFLFSESLRDNILLGSDDGEALERALDLAALRVDVDALPAGVETQVGESGLMLSGGQRQRSALARGLIREPTVLLLDDVLSAVDHGTEAELIASMRQQGGLSPTTVIVANRISALQHADVILVLRGGVVVDRGTHEELIARPGLYRDTWDKQREGEDAA
ncbi:MAG: ABC transporter ATP-binding protein [Deltaproteobacteria bacterium]|nr:MAG: ABC transporter ATP-binding protein [Deltaproteobacteria bacterium]